MVLNRTKTNNVLFSRLICALDARGFFNNMERRPVVIETWAPAEIIGTVDGDATTIVFGTLMIGVGTAWYDDLELSVQASDGTWWPIEIQDAGFEASDPLTGWRTGTGSVPGPQLTGWRVTIDPQSTIRAFSNGLPRIAIRLVRSRARARQCSPRAPCCFGSRGRTAPEARGREAGKYLRGNERVA